jgi:3-isopropylmalate dehydrogenase
VYDLRRRLDLFCKITPIQAATGLPEASPLRSSVVDGVDLLLLRENLAGPYQGRAWTTRGPDGGRVVRHEFDHDETIVHRFLAAAARVAAARRGQLTVAVKQAGMPETSELWSSVAAEVAAVAAVDVAVVDVDLLAYQLVTRPAAFDVVASPNLVGDILADLAASIIGGRGLSHSANLDAAGGAVYQTGHGSAHDLAGTDRANPAGHLLALAMLLRHSLRLGTEADAVEAGLRRVWDEGWRTDDVAGGADPGLVIGLRAFAEKVADAAAKHLASR